MAADAQLLRLPLQAAADEPELRAHQVFAHLMAITPRPRCRLGCSLLLGLIPMDLDSLVLAGCGCSVLPAVVVWFSACTT